MTDGARWERDGPYLRRSGPDFRMALLLGVEVRPPLDVTVELNDGIPRFATLFTVESIQEIMTAHSGSGERLNGEYLWADHMVIVRSLEPELIEKVVADLIDSADIYSAFGTEQV